MKRTTIMLPEELRLRAMKRAERDGLSLGELIRQSLKTTLANAGKSPKEDPFFADKAVWRGPAPRDLAKNHDKYLYDQEP
jgi:hypothetical protein